MSPIPEIFACLFDDASLFPPAELPMPDAVRDHAAHCRAWYMDLVGPFVCTDRRLEELRSHLNGGDPGGGRTGGALGDGRTGGALGGGRTGGALGPLALSLVVGGGAAGVKEALASGGGDHRLRIAAVEVAVESAEAARDVVGVLDAGLDPSALGYLEVPRNASMPSVLDALAGTRHRAKLRTGGTTAAAFPPAGEVASFIAGAVARSLVFKCTAGLHHAVRHTALDTGFEHHGFLNVLLAVEAVTAGGDEGAAAAVLAERDAAAVARGVSALPPERVTAVRASLASVGTCSIDEPVEDLVALGLLSTP